MTADQSDAWGGLPARPCVTCAPPALVPRHLASGPSTIVCSLSTHSWDGSGLIICKTTMNFTTGLLPTWKHLQFKLFPSCWSATCRDLCYKVLLILLATLPSSPDGFMKNQYPSLHFKTWNHSNINLFKFVYFWSYCQGIWGRSIIF